MGKRREPRERQRSRLSHHHVPDKFAHERTAPPIAPRNATQARYLHALATYEQVFVLGPAGTGKTWLAATYAADLLRQRELTKIILTRPNVPAGRSLGYFPGDLNQKFAPWAAPVVQAIQERMGRAPYELALRNGDIELVPFEVIRGRTFKDAFVLLDEAQNATPEEMKVFLTRIGEDCTAVINGDVTQCDLEEESGLARVLAMIREQGLPVPIIEFTADDIVRSGACAMWVRVFDQYRNDGPAILSAR